MTPNLTKTQAEDSIEPGQYYRARRTINKKENLVKGRMCLVTEVTRRKVEYILLTDEFGPGGLEKGSSEVWGDDPTDFINKFELEPNGKQIHDQRLMDAINAARSTSQEINEVATRLASIDRMFQPKALTGEVEGAKFEIPDGVAPEETALDETREVGLQRVHGASTMLQQATEWIGGIADKRNEISVKKRDLAEMQNRIKNIQLEQKQWIEAIMKFKDITEKLEEVISTLNLYLGTGEDIIQLTNGKPCPIDVPLSVRQLVLFMDEECALEAETGGIDFHSMDLFDKWLLADPRNLNQVLPEPKGIVCFKPRRKMKDYSEDPHLQALLNKENRTTYVLIRNGENLFRVCPPWSVGSRFFPSKEEFRDAFTVKKRRYNQETHATETVEEVVTPEHPDYEEVVESLDAEMRKYSKALIMLQGIVDRTGIFPEYQEIGMNLMDVTQWTDKLRFIHDADPAYLLTTGRETFDEYQTRLNGELTHGDRVIGMYSHLERESKEEFKHLDERERPSRRNPKTADMPEDLELYLLEARRGYGLCIHYDYQRRITKSGYYMNPDTGKSEYHWAGDRMKSKTRASFQIKPDDDYIMAFDRVALEDVEYYLNDRLSRQSYMSMFPLLKLVRDLKRKERDEEEPLLQLLIAQAIVREPDLSQQQARREMSRLMAWYKFKNKIHRAISDDYDKACRMILAEWAAYRETEQAKATVNVDELVERLKNDDTLIIALRRNYAFVLERENQDKIFVRKIDLYRTKAGYKRYNEKRWTVPSAAYLGWDVVWEHEDWAGWIKGARVGDYLTPAEIDEVVEKSSEETKKRAVDRVMRNIAGWNHEEKKIAELVSCDRVAIKINTDGNEIEQIYIVTVGYKGRRKTQFYGVDAKWARRRTGIELEYDYYGNNYVDSWGPNEDMTGPFDPMKSRSYFTFLDMEKIEGARAVIKAQKDREDERDAKRRFFSRADYELRKHVEQLLEREALDKYVAAFGDPLNWDSFKKDRKRAGIREIEHDRYDWLEDALGDRYAAGKIDPDLIYNKTIEEIVNLIAPLTPKTSKLHDGDWVADRLGELRDDGVDCRTYVYIRKPEPEDENEDEAEGQQDEGIEDDSDEETMELRFID